MNMRILMLVLVLFTSKQLNNNSNVGYQHSFKYLNLCSTKESNSNRFGTAWGWVNDTMFIFGWVTPLRHPVGRLDIAEALWLKNNMLLCLRWLNLSVLSMLAGYGGSSSLAAQSDLDTGRGSGGTGHSGAPARPQPAPTPAIFPPTDPSLSRSRAGRVWSHL